MNTKNWLRDPYLSIHKAALLSAAEILHIPEQTAGVLHMPEIPALRKLIQTLMTAWTAQWKPVSNQLTENCLWLSGKTFQQY